MAKDERRIIEARDKDTTLVNMLTTSYTDDLTFVPNWYDKDINGLNYLKSHYNGEVLANLLISLDDEEKIEIWEMLEHVCVQVQLLVYAAPYGNAEAHMRRLSQGGEFIIHLWALLYHLDIREWKVQEVINLHNIDSTEEAEKILNDDNGDLDVAIYYAYYDKLQEHQDAFVTASSVINGAKFYLTSSSLVAEFLKFPAASVSEGIGILFRKNTDKKITFFDSQVYNLNDDGFARFVYENKLASTKARAARAQEEARLTI